MNKVASITLTLFLFPSVSYSALCLVLPTKSDNQFLQYFSQKIIDQSHYTLANEENNDTMNEVFFFHTEGSIQSFVEIQQEIKENCKSIITIAQGEQLEYIAQYSTANEILPISIMKNTEGVVYMGVTDDSYIQELSSYLKKEHAKYTDTLSEEKKEENIYVIVNFKEEREDLFRAIEREINLNGFSSLYFSYKDNTSRKEFIQNITNHIYSSEVQNDITIILGGNRIDFAHFTSTLVENEKSITKNFQYIFLFGISHIIASEHYFHKKSHGFFLPMRQYKKFSTSTYSNKKKNIIRHLITDMLIHDAIVIGLERVSGTYKTLYTRKDNSLDIDVKLRPMIKYNRI